MSDDPSTWPKGVTPIAIDDLARLGLDANNHLHFDGRRVEIRQRISLGRSEKILALLVSVAALLGGLGAVVTGTKDGLELACDHGAAWACPHPPEAATKR